MKFEISPFVFTPNSTYIVAAIGRKVPFAVSAVSPPPLSVSTGTTSVSSGGAVSVDVSRPSVPPPSSVLTCGESVSPVSRPLRGSGVQAASAKSGRSPNSDTDFMNNPDEPSL